MKFAVIALAWCLVTSAAIASSQDKFIIPADKIAADWVIYQKSSVEGWTDISYGKKKDRQYPFIIISIRPFEDTKQARTFFSQKFPKETYASFAEVVSEYKDTFQFLDIKKRVSLVGRYVLTIDQSGSDAIDDRKPFFDAYRILLEKKTEQDAAANP